MAEFLEEVFRGLRSRRLASNAIHEQFSILRSFQFVAEYRECVNRGLDAGGRVGYDDD